MKSRAWLESRDFSAGDCLCATGVWFLCSIYGLGLPLLWWLNCTVREQIISRYSIVSDKGQPGMQCMDYFVSCCCATCAACQHARELDIRGLRPRPRPRQ